MRTQSIGLELIIAGIAVAIVAALTGGFDMAIFLFIPVFVVRSALAGLGVLMIMAGIFLLLFLPYASMEKDVSGGPVNQPVRQVEKRSAGVILIGPIPIIWGTDNRMALLATVISLIVIAGLMLFLFVL